MVVKKRPMAKKAESYECCEPKFLKVIIAGCVLILMGFAVKFGFALADLFMLIGVLLLIKALIIATYKK